MACPIHLSDLALFMPLSRALFLDRDGNLIEDHHHTREIEQITLIDEVKPALSACLGAGYKLFILTNQSGINRGIFTWEQYHACNQRMLELLDLPAPGILEIKAAPEKPDEPSLYRKPSPRFILEMISLHAIDPHQSWMVGDRRTDWDAGRNAGIRSCAVQSGASIEADFDYARTMNYVIRKNFPEFVRLDLGLSWA